MPTAQDLIEDISSEDFLDSDYREPSGNNRFALQDGENSFRILSRKPIQAWRYFTEEVAEDGKVRKRAHYFEQQPTVIPDNIARNEKGEADRPQFCWVVTVFDYSDNSVKEWTVSQKGIRNDLAAIFKSSTFRDRKTGKQYHPSKYDISIVKNGAGLGTTYNVIPGQLETFMIYKDGKEMPEKATEALEAARQMEDELRATLFLNGDEPGIEPVDDAFQTPEEKARPKTVSEARKRAEEEAAKVAAEAEAMFGSASDTKISDIPV